MNLVKENELTPTLKLRRHIIEEHYKKRLKRYIVIDL